MIIRAKLEGDGINVSLLLQHVEHNNAIRKLICPYCTQKPNQVNKILIFFLYLCHK